MCGITGFIHADTSKKASREKLKEITDIISHRGPDGEGYYIFNNLALGHRRLSIIDLVSGDQPMFSEDRNITIIYNGEIYNYIELKNDLIKKGYNFSTTSDTEVVINSYLEYGYDCLNYFNGMWAFALWDNRKKILFLSRDRIGEKPLFYSMQNGTFVFGSEIKSIIKYFNNSEFNYELLEIYLTLGFIPSPYTFFKNIHKLEPGQYLIFDNGTTFIRRYWDLPEIDEKNLNQNKNEIYNQFESLLRDATRIRMHGDVPFGAFLSGGLDSSSIVSIMANISSTPVKTFTIGFENKDYDERKIANIVSQKFQTEHYEYIVTPSDFETALEKVVFHFDEPFGDSSAIPTGFVAKSACNHVKMVLTGDGGDETLSGYWNYKREIEDSKIEELPFFVRNFLAALISCMSNTVPGKLKYKLLEKKNRIDLINGGFLNRAINRQSQIDLKDKDNIIFNGIKQISVIEFLTNFFNKCPYVDNFYKLMYYDHKLRLPEDMLVKVDRMSMAYALETRTPFLDHRLIEFMVNVDKCIKLDKNIPKAILKNTIASKLPTAVLNHKKMGFSVPVKKWFSNKSFEIKQKELLMSNNLPINKEFLEKIFYQNKLGYKDNGNLLWMLFVLEKVLSKVTI
jgi:asparagine synthase (glutamine-hydrolysing)